MFRYHLDGTCQCIQEIHDPMHHESTALKHRQERCMVAMFLQEIQNCLLCQKPLKNHPKKTAEDHEPRLHCQELSSIIRDTEDTKTLERIAWNLIDILATKIDVSALIPILATHPTPDIRLALARALDSLTYHGYDVKPWMRRLAIDPDEEVASRVIWCLPAIAYFRPAIIFPIFDCLMSRSMEIKVKCLKMLSELPHENVDLNPFLVRAISEPKRSLRDMTGKIILHLSMNGVNICTAIKVALQISTPTEFRIACVRSLINLLPLYFEPLQEEALSLLVHEDEKIRATAVRILPILAARGIKVYNHIVDFLEHPSPHVRSQLAWILPELSDATVSRDLIETIMTRLSNDEHPQACIELIYRLPDMKERGFDINELLETLTARPEPEIRAAICSQIARLSYTGMNINKLFDRYLDDPDPKVRKTLAKILPRIGGKNNISVFHRFRELTEDSEPEVITELINQLERIITKCLMMQVPKEDVYHGLLNLSKTATPEQQKILSKITCQLFNRHFFDESEATLLLLSTEGLT